jgi:hypothetical protein
MEAISSQSIKTAIFENKENCPHPPNHPYGSTTLDVAALALYRGTMQEKKNAKSRLNHPLNRINWHGHMAPTGLEAKPK